MRIGTNLTRYTQEDSPPPKSRKVVEFDEATHNADAARRQQNIAAGIMIDGYTCWECLQRLSVMKTFEKHIRLQYKDKNINLLDLARLSRAYTKATEDDKRRE